MLDLKYIRSNRDSVVQKLGTRGISSTAIDELISLDSQLRASNQQLETLQAEKNLFSRTIGTLKPKDRDQKIQDMTALTRQEKVLSETITTIEQTVSRLLRDLPNIPLDDVPVGRNAQSNITLREVGDKRRITKPRDYLSIAESLDIIDVERAAKVSGSRFGYLKGDGALLEFALVQYALGTLTKAGYVPMVPPVLIGERFMEAMGYLAQGGDDEVYRLPKDSLYLVGTAEQSVGPYHADEVLLESTLPKRYVAFSTCFRREAGSYGKDTRGILRVHQFDKLEMFAVTTPAQSEAMHQEIMQLQEQLVSDLRLPYRVVQLCTGDLGTPSAKTYDIECWMPGQNGGHGEYRETHSTSNTTDYQARALNIRIKQSAGKNVTAHLLNGTAFAIGRILIAIIENGQQSDGSVTVPAVLQPYLAGRSVISQAR